MLIAGSVLPFYNALSLVPCNLLYSQLHRFNTNDDRDKSLEWNKSNAPAAAVSIPQPSIHPVRSLCRIFDTVQHLTTAEEAKEDPAQGVWRVVHIINKYVNE